MRRFVARTRLAIPSAALALGVSTAGAAPPAVEAEDLSSLEGLTLVAFSQPNACPTDPWNDALAETLMAMGARPITVARNAATVDVVLGEDAFRTKGMAVAFRDGTRIDVLCGCPDADDLAAWAQALTEDRSWADHRRDNVTDTKERLDVGGHLEVSQRETCRGDLDAAFGELAFLWTKMPEVMPDERVLRFNRVGRDMAVLARADEGVASKIGAMRDAIDPNASIEALEEWIALNRILLQDKRTVGWFDEVQGDADKRFLVEHAAPSLFGMLVEAGRWADAGGLIGDPLDWLADRKRAAGGLDMALDDHAALVAAGRYGDAKRLGLGVVKAMPDDPNTACKLIDRSLTAGATHKSQTAIARKCDNPVLYEKWDGSL